MQKKSESAAHGRDGYQSEEAQEFSNETPVPSEMAPEPEQTGEARNGRRTLSHSFICVFVVLFPGKGVVV